MSRRKTWIIAYDVREPGRLQRLHKFLSKHAVTVQYSIFAADLTEKELERVIARIGEIIDPAEDDVRLYAVPAGAGLHMSGHSRLGDGTMLFGEGAAQLVQGHHRRR
jgi:CRISPR-associated protein Cas2